MAYTVEELVVNDSFIAFCIRQQPEAIAFWNDYLSRHPEELLTMEEARKLVLGLRLMLQQKQNELHCMWSPISLHLKRKQAFPTGLPVKNGWL